MIFGAGLADFSTLGFTLIVFLVMNYPNFYDFNLFEV
jgi:hypothetical protein